MQNMAKVSNILIKFRLFFLAKRPKTYQSWDEKQRFNLERPYGML